MPRSSRLAQTFQSRPIAEASCEAVRAVERNAGKDLMLLPKPAKNRRCEADLFPVPRSKARNWTSPSGFETGSGLHAIPSIIEKIAAGLPRKARPDERRSPSTCSPINRQLRASIGYSERSIIKLRPARRNGTPSLRQPVGALDVRSRSMATRRRFHSTDRERWRRHGAARQYRLRHIDICRRRCA
jgi:hypothetical protein